METDRSPRITRLAWGVMEVEAHPSFKDARLYPGGAEKWDWNDTGTSHSPGIQPADVAAIVDRGATAVVLSRGMLGRLRVCPETLSYLEERGIDAHVHRTEEAARVYNELCQTEAVGGLFHSTC